MSSDYNISSNGIERSDFMFYATYGQENNSKSAGIYYSIWGKLDTNGDGVLDEKEVSKLKEQLEQANRKDGNESNLSNKDLKWLLGKLGISNRSGELEDSIRNLKTFIEDLCQYSREATNTSVEKDQEGNTVITKKVQLKDKNFVGKKDSGEDNNNVQFKRDLKEKDELDLHVTRDKHGRIIKSESLNESNEIVTTAYEYNNVGGKSYIKTRTTSQPRYEIYIDQNKNDRNKQNLTWVNVGGIETHMNYLPSGQVKDGTIVVFDKHAGSVSSNKRIDSGYTRWEHKGSNVEQGFERQYNGTNSYTDTYYMTKDGKASAANTGFYVKVTVSIGNDGKKSVTRVEQNVPSSEISNIDSCLYDYDAVHLMNMDENSNGLLTQYMLSSLREHEVKV